MKSVTEFHTHKLVKGIDAKTALAAEGKTPEEIEQSLGETFKLEGDKLKYFTNAITVATDNMEKLARVLVVQVNEGESAPEKAVQIDEHHYIPEFQTAARAPITTKPTKGGPQNNKGKGKRKDGPKTSPWGLTPEEIAAKKGGKAQK